MQKKKVLRSVLWAAAAAVLCLSAACAGAAASEPTAEAESPTKAPAAAAAATKAPAKAPTKTAVLEKTCGQTGSLTMLFTGTHNYEDEVDGGADAIRLIEVDFDALKVDIVSIPHDMVVESVSPDNAARAKRSLHLIFQNSNKAASGTINEKNAEAALAVGQAISENFDVKPDNYITLQMDSFAAMVDSIGGVEVDIPTAFEAERGFSFAAGKQTLDGAQATEYVRHIADGETVATEAERIARQNAFFDALLTKMFSVSMLPKVPVLFAQFKDALSTDLTLAQIASLACLTEKLPEDGITFSTLNTPDMVVNNVPDIDAIKAFFAEMLSS